MPTRDLVKKNAYAKWYRETHKEQIRQRYRENAHKYKTVRRKASRRFWRKDWLPGEHEKAEQALRTVFNCEACGTDEPRHTSGKFVADHSKVLGRFRGVLCNPCNIMLGFYDKYKTPISNQLLSYLERFNAVYSGK